MSEVLAYRWSTTLISSLRELGVQHFVVSPGSRSTPLTVAAWACAQPHVHMVVDERAAAFFALGIARVSGKPVVLICTSGSALAHYFPAVLEAELAHIPLIVLSADRPLELVGSGASQTLDQIKLFGGHVRLSSELGSPDEAALDALPSLLARAVLAATSTPAGPVHLNARFRKPLEPSAAYFEPSAVEGVLAVASDRKAPTLFRSQRSPAPEALLALRELSSLHGGATVVVGALQYRAEERASTIASLRAAVDNVAARGHVVLCEPASGLALAPEHGIHATAHALLNRSYRERPAGLLIELGLPPVDPAYEAFCARADCRVAVGPHGIHDPKGTAQLAVESDLVPFLQAFAAQNQAGPSVAQPDAISLTAHLRALALREQRAEGGLSEPFVSIELASLLERGQLFLGNSLPIRDFALFAHSHCSPQLGVVHQRGHAGIDGYFAGAAGVRVATPQQEPVVALFGDVTAAHDLGSLALLSQLGPLQAPLVIVVINNAGGRIFERLPIAKSGLPRPAFEALFLTAPTLSVAAVAAAMGLVSARCDNKSDFRASLTSALAEPRVTVLEAVVDQAADRADRAWFAEVLA